MLRHLDTVVYYNVFCFSSWSGRLVDCLVVPVVSNTTVRYSGLCPPRKLSSRPLVAAWSIGSSGIAGWSSILVSLWSVRAAPKWRYLTENLLLLPKLLYTLFTALFDLSLLVFFLPKTTKLSVMHAGCSPTLCVRGLYIVTGQYSLLCVSAVVLNLGGDDIVEVLQDRELADSEREKIEVRDKEKGDKTRTDNAHSNM